jgi:hypothetical protein
VRIPDEPDFRKIFFAVSKQAISVVYAEEGKAEKYEMGKEFMVV